MVIFLYRGHDDISLELGPHFQTKRYSLVTAGGVHGHGSESPDDFATGAQGEEMCQFNSEVSLRCPSSLAKLMQITPITMVYGRYIYTCYGL